MDFWTIVLMGVVILAVVAIVFAFKYQAKGKVTLTTKLGTLKAEGENPAPPTSVASGVRIKGAKAGNDITALSTTEGGVDVEDVDAKGKIDARHDQMPPKA